MEMNKNGKSRFAERVFRILTKDGWPNRFVGYNEVFSDSRCRGTGAVGWSVKIHTHRTQSTINNTVLVGDMRKKTTYIHHQQSADLQNSRMIFISFFFVHFLIVY